MKKIYQVFISIAFALPPAILLTLMLLLGLHFFPLLSATVIEWLAKRGGFWAAMSALLVDKTSRSGLLCTEEFAQDPVLVSELGEARKYVGEARGVNRREAAPVGHLPKGQVEAVVSLKVQPNDDNRPSTHFLTGWGN